MGQSSLELSNDSSHYQHGEVNFDIQGGIRQGCPLSQLLFVSVIEPFAETIRCDPAISGLGVRQKSHKVSLYPDDILLFILNPAVSV